VEDGYSHDLVPLIADNHVIIGDLAGGGGLGLLKSMYRVSAFSSSDEHT